MQQHFEGLISEGRLVALAGDLMKPRLGLADDVYERLTREVDAVVHNGALVNHAYSYEELFEPNVLGTVEVIRFALKRRIKSITFTSSVGIATALRRLAHSEAPREINSADYFTRLLCGLAYTRIAPRSFYEQTAAESAHFDGLPVDFVARSIANIATDGRTDYALRSGAEKPRPSALR